MDDMFSEAAAADEDSAHKHWGEGGVGCASDGVRAIESVSATESASESAVKTPGRGTGPRGSRGSLHVQFEQKEDGREDQWNGPEKYEDTNGAGMGNQILTSGVSPSISFTSRSDRTSSRENSNSSDSTSSSSSSSSDDDSSLEKFVEPRPPDGGWGWVVVAASFFVNLIADGITFSFGVIFVDFLKYFGEGKSKTAWIGSLFMAMPLLSGPIASFLTDRFGCRCVTIVGALMAATGFVISSFTNSVELLFLTFGIFAGFGLSLCYVAAVVIVAYYFDQKRSFATGLSVCGSGIGTFVFAPLTQYLLDEYSWRGTTLILAGFFLNLCVCGALMRDLAWTSRSREERAQKAKLERKARRRKRRGHHACNSVKSVRTNGSSADTMSGGGPALLGIEQLRKLLQTPGTTAIHLGDGSSLTEPETAARMCSSLVNLPTFVRNKEKVPLEVMELLSTNSQLYKILQHNYPNLIASRSFSDSGRLNEHQHQPLEALPVGEIFHVTLEPHDEEQELLTDAQTEVKNENGLCNRRMSNGNVECNNSKKNEEWTHNDTAEYNKQNHMNERNKTVDISGIQVLSNVINGNAGSEKISVEIKVDQKNGKTLILSDAETKEPLTINCTKITNGKLLPNGDVEHANGKIIANGAGEQDGGKTIETGDVDQGSVMPHHLSINSQTQQHGKKLATSYLRDLRVHRHSLTYRGAMLNINRYRLRASSCPDIYRNSMTTIAKEKDEWYSGLWELWYVLVDMLDFSHFADIRFLLFAVSNFLLYTWYDVPYVYLMDYALELKYSQNDASYLVSVIGILNMVGEIALGWMGDRSWVNPGLVYAVCMAACGVVVALIPLLTSLNELRIVAGAFGLLIAANYSLTSIILVELITIERFTNAYGLLLLVQGVANLVGPPLGGWLYDVTGSYDLSFYLAGIFIALSGLLLFVLPSVEKYRSIKSKRLRKDPAAFVSTSNSYVAKIFCCGSEEQGKRRADIDAV